MNDVIEKFEKDFGDYILKAYPNSKDGLYPKMISFLRENCVSKELLREKIEGMKKQPYQIGKVIKDDGPEEIMEIYTDKDEGYNQAIQNLLDEINKL